jgi:hypothetical protein
VRSLCRASTFVISVRALSDISSSVSDESCASVCGKCLILLPLMISTLSFDIAALVKPLSMPVSALELLLQRVTNMSQSKRPVSELMNHTWLQYGVHQQMLIILRTSYIQTLCSYAD